MSLENDPDLEAEVLKDRGVLEGVSAASAAPAVRAPAADARADPEAAALQFVPLATSGGSFSGSRASAALLRRIGGGAAVHRLLEAFYAKMFVDGHISQFVMSQADPHAARLANWIIEKMGGEGDVWSRERVERGKCPVAVHLPMRGEHVVHDRTSAHVAAWFCPARPEHRLGEHFKLHDTRVWMRLMFWSCRETGLFADKVFESWFVRFIGHFIRVYEGMAPLFTRDSARWSLDEGNIAAYRASGNTMPADVLGPAGEGVSAREAARQVPKSEFNETVWPYSTHE
jgi:truncated hemoglobin YjbI